MINLFRQTKHYHSYILLAPMLFLLVACGGSQPLEDTSILATPLPIPTGTVEVAYGASLSEWEEATQGDSEQSEQAANNVEPEEDNSALPIEASEIVTDEILASTIGTPFTFDNILYQEIFWDGLIPADYTPTAIMERYEGQLAELEDGSPEAVELYTLMQAEFDNAPTNEVLNEILVRIPGFIAPLDYTDERITEFLLVPYFGACIHTPPPPANQTVLVTTAAGQGIEIEDSYNPIWVMGKMKTEAIDTDLAAAGYNISEASIEPYTEEPQ